MDDVIGPGAMKALHARGGSVFRILEGGVIRVGDAAVREMLRESAQEGSLEGS